MPYVFILLYKFPSTHQNKRISSRGSYDNTGQPYNVTQIINADSSFNEAKYKAYSPLFLSFVIFTWINNNNLVLFKLLYSATFAMAYGVSFASITATLTHAFLYYRKQIWIQSRRSIDEQPDIHARLMSHYRQVPDWWYATLFGRSLSSTLRFHLTLDLLSFVSDHVHLWYCFYWSLARGAARVGIRPRLGYLSVPLNRWASI